MNNYVIAFAIGCAVLVVVGYKLFPKSADKPTTELAEENRRLHHENAFYKLEITRNRNAIHEIKKKIEAIELRQNQADLWFGSIIRHSRAQFDRQAVEDFIKEQGIDKGEEE